MSVTECEIPSISALDRDAIKGAYFHDCYRAPLARLDLGIVDIFFAVFGHHPLWIRLLLVVRNIVAKRAGLDTPTVADIMSPEIRACYCVGDKIGPWPIFFDRSQRNHRRTRQPAFGLQAVGAETH